MKIYDYNGKKNICGDRLREARVVQRLRQEDLAAKIQTMGVNEVATMAEKRKTKTSSAVKNRYNNRVYGSIIVRVPKEMAEAFKEKCAATGTAQAQVIKKAIEQFLAE